MINLATWRHVLETRRAYCKLVFPTFVEQGQGPFVEQGQGHLELSQTRGDFSHLHLNNDHPPFGMQTAYWRQDY